MQIDLFDPSMEPYYVGSLIPYFLNFDDRISSFIDLDGLNDCLDYLISSIMFLDGLWPWTFSSGAWIPSLLPLRTLMISYLLLIIFETTMCKKKKLLRSNYTRNLNMNAF